MNLEEAARNLATIRETQAKAMRFQPWLPVWFMAGIGLFVTGVQFITEPGIPKPVAVGLGIVLAAGMGALVAVFAKTRRMTVSGHMATSAVLPVYLPGSSWASASTWGWSSSSAAWMCRSAAPTQASRSPPTTLWAVR